MNKIQQNLLVDIVYRYCVARKMNKTAGRIE